MNKKYKWSTLTYDNIIFPDKYIKHNTPLIYDNKKIILNKDAEEYATLYSKYINTEYVNNSLFKKNFWNDWKKTLPDNIKKLDLCDFSLIKEYIDNNKIKKDKKINYAIVDGIKEKISNTIEPPGIFIGRGGNKNIGKIKKRIKDSDIIINIDKYSKIPPGNWKNVIHDNNLQWIASWKDNISNKTKYIWLGSESIINMKNDLIKFNIARKLKKNINNILKINNNNLLNKDIRIKMIATVIYFINKLLIRVGNDLETESYGISTLKCKHIKLYNNNKIKFNFIGKDFIKYKNLIEINPIIYNNMVEFIKDKNQNDKIFSLINSKMINNYLNNILKGLSTKIFRTYRVSDIFQSELLKIKKNNDVLYNFFIANIKIAKICNHKKKISKNYNKDILTLNEKIKKNPNLKKKRKIKILSKDLSLTTSKKNYIDPRIIVSFCKKHNIDIEKIYTKNLLKKFNWALNTNLNFIF